MKNKRKRPMAFLALTLSCFFLFLSLALSSCATLPRIIILHDPLTPAEHVNLGVAYERKGQYDAAMKQYREASKKLPAAWVYMGNASFEKGDMGKAEKYYKKAIDKDKNNPDGYNNLAWLYYTEKKKLDDAETLAGKAVLLSANDPAKETTYKDTLNKIKALKGEAAINTKNKTSPEEKKTKSKRPVPPSYETPGIFPFSFPFSFPFHQPPPSATKSATVS